MPTLFHLVVIATDFLGYARRHEMTVIAGDDDEVREEIESFFALRDVTESWTIAETIERRLLAAGDEHAIAYRERGPHSYIAR